MINSDNNFCRVFELPTSYPEGLLFGGGKPVNFIMVDWFNPIPPMELWSDKEVSIDEWKNSRQE